MPMGIQILLKSKSFNINVIKRDIPDKKVKSMKCKMLDVGRVIWTSEKLETN